MKRNLLYFKLFSFLLISSNYANAQQSKIWTCSADEIREDMFKQNPDLKKIYETKQEEFRVLKKTELNGRKELKANQIIEIPIVIHVLNDGTGKYTPTDSQIHNWIARANAIFDGTAQDIKGPDEGGTTLPIRLVLAKRSPANTTTNGIINHDLSNNSTYVNYGVNGKGLTNQYLNDTYNWDSNSYYNIYITNMIDGVNPSNTTGAYTAGFAYYPGGGLDLSVMLYHVAINNRDTTFAHEMMHAFNVAHPFNGGDGNGVNCGSLTNDEIEDTQNIRSGLFFGNPNNSFNQYKTYPTIYQTINDCSNTPFDHTLVNMMNYGRNLDRFTPGQGDRALDAIYFFRSSFLTSLALVEPTTINNIPIESCQVQGNIGHLNFDKVEFNTLSKKGINYKVYNDYSKSNNINTAYITEVTEGQNYQLNITTRANPNIRKVFVYIDYNGNGIFEANEVALSNHDLVNNIINISTNINIPTTALKNTPLRMRVVGDLSNIYNGYQHITYGACDSRVAGQVEDFTIIVKEASSTIWNGTTWSTGEPTETKEAIVRGDLILNSTEKIITNKFTLESGSVKLNNYSTIISPIIENKLSADKFVVTGNNSGLLQRGNNTSTIGEFTIIQESSPMIFNDAALWSSPVKNQNLKDFSPNTLLKRFYKYNETTNKFASLFVYDELYPNSDLKNPATYNFEPGVGYHIRVGTDFPTTKPGKTYVGKFIGELNSGVFNVNVTKNNFGYNLIGNPYPAPIIADNILNNNPSINALYFWTQESPLTANGYASNNYASYTLAGGVQAAAGGKIPNGNIAIGQGFFVEMNTANSLFLHNNFTGWNDQAIFHKNEEAIKRIRLNLFENTIAKNQILISYMANATNGFDNQIDGKINRMFNGSTLYSIIDGSTEKYVIQGRAPFKTDDSVKLGFEAKENATYTIKLNNTENLDNQSIFLKDKTLNQIIDLTKDYYTFDSQSGIYNDRFEIIYTNKTLTTNELNKQNVQLFIDNGAITLKSPKEINFIEVYDISGRKVLEKNTSSKQVVLSELKKNNQILLIKVSTTDSKTLTIKTVF
ncbi:GEVED domain-containing protein [Empedobacter tilapiae]